MNIIYKFIFYINLSFMLVGCKEQELEKAKEVRDTLKISNGNNIIYEKRSDKISLLLLKENNQRKRSYEFYETGNPKEITDYYNDKVIKIQDFFDTGSNCTKVISSFVFNHSINSQIPMSRQVYDSCGVLNSLNSIYIDIKSSTGRDTFNIGEKAKIVFSWRYLKNYEREYEKRILIGGFDNEFNIIDENSIKVYEVNGKSFEQDLNVEKLGNNVIRGVLLERVILGDSMVKTNPLFFEYNYYVKKKKKIIPAYTTEYFNFFIKQFKPKHKFPRKPDTKQYEQNRSTTK